MITKKDYVIRYTTYWLNYILIALAPLGVTIAQFGLFKEDVGFFSRLQGTTIIGLIIVFAISRDEIVQYLKDLENQGWYKSVKTSMIWTIIFGMVLWSFNFTTEMLWVVGSFTAGSWASVPVNATHRKYLKKIKPPKKEKDTI